MISPSSLALLYLISFFPSSHAAIGRCLSLLTDLLLDILSMAPWPSLQRDAVAGRCLQRLRCGVVLSEPSESCQHRAESSWQAHPAWLSLCHTQQSRAFLGTSPPWDPASSTPSHCQPCHCQSQLLRELNKHLGCCIPDKALFLFCETMSHFLSDTNPRCCSSSSPKQQFNPRHVGVNSGNYSWSCLQLREGCGCFRCSVSAR